MAARFNNDRIFYTAFNDCGKFGIEAIVDPSMTRAELVENIRRGETGYDNVIAVHAYNPVDGFAIEITDEIFEEVDAAAQAIRDADDFPSTAGVMRQFDALVAALRS